MLHVDMPTRSDLERLITHREPACVSIYLPTTPLTQDAQADRIALKNLASEAASQLRASGHGERVVRAIEAHLEELVEDDDFWATQARSLAVFVTEGRVLTFRLANRLKPATEVADRFHVKPLLRAVTAGHQAFVLALSQSAVRLVEVTADVAAATVKVPDMPRDMSHAVGRGSLESRSARGRIQGSEGKKVRMAQYARAVDGALREFLAGRETPLILACTEPLDGIFRATCTYPHLVGEPILGNPDSISDHDLALAARGVLDAVHARDVADFAALFEQRGRDGRTTTDIAHAAKAATYGAVSAIAVDIDTTVPGLVDDEDGSVTFADKGSADTHGVVDQIAGRVLLSGGRVLALRAADIPGGGQLAAVLRYPF